MTSEKAVQIWKDRKDATKAELDNAESVLQLMADDLAEELSIRMNNELAEEETKDEGSKQNPPSS